MDIETVWYEHAGMSEWKDHPDGSRSQNSLWRNMVTGEIHDTGIHGLPTGAVFAYPLEPNEGHEDSFYRRGYDGKSIVCVVPNGGWWCIDGRASNCTMPDDNVHRCWCRHGTVGDRLHVDKNGNTCAAGAGSIQMGDYHGFLHNGKLTNA